MGRAPEAAFSECIDVEILDYFPDSRLTALTRLVENGILYSALVSSLMQLKWRGLRHAGTWESPGRLDSQPVSDWRTRRGARRQPRRCARGSLTAALTWPHCPPPQVSPARPTAGHRPDARICGSAWSTGVHSEATRHPAGLCVLKIAPTSTAGSYWLHRMAGRSALSVTPESPASGDAP